MLAVCDPLIPIIERVHRIRGTRDARVSDSAGITGVIARNANKIVLLHSEGIFITRELNNNLIIQ